MVFKTVLVGADDSQTARQAMMIAANVAQISGVKLHIVTAYDPRVSGPRIFRRFR
jgi:nucleotide-binding universal stress UspA family protein